ncbi:MAG: VanZ family protein [Chthoniobacterales bacterium]
MEYRRFRLVWAILAWVAFFLWAALATWLSSLPARSLPKAPISFEQMDKVLHAGLFFVGSLFFVIALALSFSRAPRYLLFLASLILLAGFGAVNEWQQVDVFGRSGGDIWDATANLVGVILGSSFLFLLFYRRPRRQGNQQPAPDISAAITPDGEG